MSKRVKPITSNKYYQLPSRGQSWKECNCHSALLNRKSAKYTWPCPFNRDFVFKHVLFHLLCLWLIQSAFEKGFFNTKGYEKKNRVGKRSMNGEWGMGDWKMGNSSQRSYCVKIRLILITPHDGQRRKEVWMLFSFLFYKFGLTPVFIMHRVSKKKL